VIIGTDFNQTIVIEALTDIEHGDGVAAKIICPEGGAEDGNLFLFQDQLPGMDVFKPVFGDGVPVRVLLDVAVIPFVVAFNQENASELLCRSRENAEPSLFPVEKPDITSQDEDGFLVVRKLRNEIVCAALLATELIVDVGHDSDKHRLYRG